MLKPISIHGARLHPLRLRVHPVIGYGLVALGLLLAFVWEGSSVDHLNIQLERAKADKHQIETRLAELSVMADDLSSLVQVEKRATRELGLRRPDTDGIVEVLFPDVRPGPRFDLGRIVPDANAQTRGTRRP
jgi:hypothetical protein